MVGSYAMPLANYCEYHSYTSWFLEWLRPTVDTGAKQQQKKQNPFLEWFIRWLETSLLSLISSSISSLRLWELLQDKNSASHPKALRSQLMFPWNDWLTDYLDDGKGIRLVVWGFISLTIYKVNYLEEIMSLLWNSDSPLVRQIKIPNPSTSKHWFKDEGREWKRNCDDLYRFGG